MALNSCWALNLLRRVSTELLNYQDGRQLSPDVLDSYQLSLELVYREVLMAQAVKDLSSDHIGELIRQALLSLQDIKDSQLAESVASPPSQVTGHAGRPFFIIPREQLCHLIEARFTVPQIANLIGVSVRTIHRRMSEYALSIQATYSDLTDCELDEIVSDIHQEFPMCGYRQMSGHLQARGIRTQQHRIRESIRRTDPEGTIARKLRTINRRRYVVAAPRSLYHIDGNHKLIRSVQHKIALLLLIVIVCTGGGLSYTAASTGTAGKSSISNVLATTERIQSYNCSSVASEKTVCLVE